jgi:hypothetical protein
MVQPEGPHMTSQYGACALHTPAPVHSHTHTHSQEYVILIAFPLQQ